VYNTLLNANECKQEQAIFKLLSLLGDFTLFFTPFGACMLVYN